MKKPWSIATSCAGLLSALECFAKVRRSQVLRLGREGPQHLDHLLLQGVPGGELVVVDGSYYLDKRKDAHAPTVSLLFPQTPGHEERLEDPADPPAVPGVELPDRGAWDLTGVHRGEPPVPRLSPEGIEVQRNNLER